jgi:phage shock protein B
MNTLIFALVFVPLLAFILVVLPLWLVLYFRDRNRQSHALSNEEWQEVRRTLAMTERLDQRLASLEAILDANHKGWRNQP